MSLERVSLNCTRHVEEDTVPSTIPYASGQAPRVTVPSAAVVDGHVPSAYMALKICSKHSQHATVNEHSRAVLTAFAVPSVAKLVPTTVMRPVPR